MDDILQAQFDRVEQALGTLVDSIASYNPNPQAAIDLVAADDGLSHGLDQLARHQANHARLHALRTEADTLEEQLKSSVAALAGLRKELSETPATIFPDNSRHVPFDELLQYAKSISKYTVPPTFRERVPDANSATSKDKEADEASASAPATNGLSTPTTATAPVDPSKDSTEAQKDDEETGAAVPEITAEEEEWLKKLKDGGFAWYPWPDSDKIRRGNLWKLYHYREQGRNLDDFNIEAYEEEERKKFSDDVPPQAPEEVQPEPQLLDQRPQQQPPAQAVPAAPARAGFTLFDDMESDDE
ncbi:vitamin-D-receptor interacting mediator subunit 4-domain-containing protein [Boeremia exigua]|uniref:vitamin-D-receptor interacting mediator subunit 4-domain-containing protein n=1 Tax=Boeremia exigua TaxID=749465 RepID=UPI001E8D5E96|nr:vitamin-D-receptor interacting mediator subunit 4-domain-containing protein [Boeremia exigua]KAH6644025.1 vitamin-D-receptor interacting mediator subunit 4-domain-containing protein [Boeremia exigua]